MNLMKMNFEGKFDTAAGATRYALAGHATITLRSAKTQTRFTYKIERRKGKDFFFVSLLTGTDNESSYQFLGIINEAGKYFPGRKSRVPAGSPAAIAFNWSWSHLHAGNLPGKLEVWHASSCGRCGRALTVPESIQSGFGPECITKVGG